MCNGLPHLPSAHENIARHVCIHHTCIMQYITVLPNTVTNYICTTRNPGGLTNRARVRPVRHWPWQHNKEHVGSYKLGIPPLCCVASFVEAQ